MTKRPYLSKTRYISGLQCHLKLWYDCYRPELQSPVTPAQQAVFDTGREVGRVATWPHPGGILVHRDALGTAGRSPPPTLPAALLAPTLDAKERAIAEVEGWILGVPPVPAPAAAAIPLHNVACTSS